MKKTTIPYKEVRPNRNVLRVNQVIDISDGGEFRDKMMGDTETNLFLDRLPEQQKKVAQMLLDGYKQCEICKILGITQQAVSKLVKKMGVVF